MQDYLYMFIICLFVFVFVYSSLHLCQMNEWLKILAGAPHSGLLARWLNENYVNEEL